MSCPHHQPTNTIDIPVRTATYARRFVLIIGVVLFAQLCGCSSGEPSAESSAEPGATSVASVSMSDSGSNAASTRSNQELMVGSSEPIAWDDASNLIQNASFESGDRPWYSLAAADKPQWINPKVSLDRAHSGEQSILFVMQDKPPIPSGVRIWGVVQDFQVDAIPRRVGGWFRVERWNRGAINQYVQCIVSVTEPDPEQFPSVPEGRSLELAFVLTGIEADPFELPFRKFVLAGPVEPTTDQWVPFEFDIHQAMKDTWGSVPTNFGSLQVIFEARFDAVQPINPVRGNVYFDDLYLGDGG